ncbi:2'-5' RNA ligase family protein [Herbiconiux sp. VKM Ac-2851]|uniref:2'-5' RNA ligase family protein n=1 Tax=Herbiconiux sp. VKM Ac-2851 TaxID=2739025 RepID=UPI001564DF99|nr:2'-5' RNA ligase family protein [Herbiconiux sp. VKM Ac-2851]NQX35156.1 2'-5' RNA ligase family protein [Herbiconiux sp. VKM Ac-2851]
MAAVVSVEAVFGAAVEAAVRAEWEALAAAGMSSLAGHTSASNAPHLTLAVRPAEGGFGPFALPGEVAVALPLPVVLGAPMLFGAGERRVLVRSVLPSAGLLALHAAVHAHLAAGARAETAAGAGAGVDAGAGTDGGGVQDALHTRPGEWTPHVTLARRIRLEQVPAALALLGGDIAGEIVGLRHWNAETATVTPLDRDVFTRS